MPIELVKCPSCGRQFVSEKWRGKYFIPHHRREVPVGIGLTCIISGEWIKIKEKS